MILPSAELYDRLLTSMGGLWAQRLSKGEHIFVAKLSRAMIKFVMQGVPIDLLVFAVATPAGNVRAIGLRVHDDADHPGSVFGPIGTLADLQALDALLQARSATFEFYDDACMPTVSLSATFDPVTCNTVCVPLRFNREINDALLDRIEDVLGGASPPQVLEQSIVRLTVSDVRPHKVAVIAAEHSIDGPDEGAQLENSAELLLDGILPPSIRGPRVADTVNKRELCDVLALDLKSNFAVVVQAKVDGIFAASPDRSPTRRVASIEKNIKKAVDQGRGAARLLLRGVPIEADVLGDEPLPLPAQQRVHAVVLVSEMHGLLKWDEIARLLLSESTDAVFFHILDMAEFQRLVSACLLSGSQQAPALLDANLLVRWRAMRDNGTAFIHARLPPRR